MQSKLPVNRLALAILFVSILFAIPARAATRVSLNGNWQFRVDPKGRGQVEEWSKAPPDNTQTVQVPGTWNIGTYDDYEGIAWYFRTFEIPPELRGKHIEIHFGATFYRARIWLNGVELGSHEGGHTAYYFVLPANVPRTNFLAVAIDNRPTETSIPGLAMRLAASNNYWYDWWHYGGIVRDVWLSVNDAILLRRQEFRVHVQGDAASVSDRIFVENDSGRPAQISLRLAAHLEGSDSKAAAETSRTITVEPGAQQADLSFQIPAVKLWHFDQPFLYDVEVELNGASGQLLDTLSDHFGARTVEIRYNKLYLNGEPVRLTGMTRHEDSPLEGLAETRGTWKYDYDDMKNLEVVLTRPVHYPQLPAILDYCDRHGILLVPEIPLWQLSRGQLGNPAVRALAKQMLREMIDEDFNHPSIFAWSVANECEIHSDEGIEYVRQMRDWEKSLDPDRFFTFADDSLPTVQDSAHTASQFADFLMWNQYLGTWHGPAALLAGVIEHIHRTFPEKMVIVSEFGVPGVFGANSQDADRLRVQILRDQLAEFAKHDWIAGAIFWCYQDYRSHRNLWPGQTSGYVDHGVVDENRQRRPSYDAWKDANSPVQLTLDWNRSRNYPYLPTGFSGSVDRRKADEIPSYALHNYRATWELRDSDNQILAHGEKELGEIGPPVQIEGNFDQKAVRAWTLIVQVYRPTGFLAGEREISWRDPQYGGADKEDMKRRGTYPPDPPILEVKPPVSPR